MVKKLKFAFLVVFSFAFLVIGLSPLAKAQELTNQQKVEEEINNVYLPSEAIFDFPLVSRSVYGSTIIWSSSNEEVIDVTTDDEWAVVTRPADADATVVLTLTITNGGATESKEFEILVKKGTTLTNTYEISYVLNGGTNASNPTSYSVGQNVSLEAPTLGTVEFLGWYLNAEFAGSPVIKLPKGTSGNVTLYAKWAPKELVSITVETNPTKVAYNALETFDSTGIVVVAHYNDNSNVDVTASASYDKTVLHFGDENVTVSFEDKTTSVDITVSKINYDLSGITFADTAVTYNGLNQTINYTGTLPEGLEANVVGNGKNVSNTPYEITLNFTNTNADYNDPASLTAELTINKAELTVKASDKTMNVGATLPTFTAIFTGFVNEETEAVLGGTLLFDCLATSASPKGQYVITPKGLTSDNYNISFVDGTLNVLSGEYTIVVDEEALTTTYDGTNKLVLNPVLKENSVTLEGVTFTYEYNEEEVTELINAGTYEVKVVYHSATYGENYQTFTLVINKADFDMSEVVFESQSFVYDGSAHQLTISNLPEGVTVNEWTNNSLTNVGEVTVTVSFTADTLNHNVVASLSQTLTVTAKALEASMFDEIDDQNHTGSAIEPVVSGSFASADLVLGTDYTVAYTNNVAKGTATVTVTGKGNFSGTVTLEFTIIDSLLELVAAGKAEIANKYNPIFAGSFLNVSQLDTTTTNGSNVYWYSVSTAIGVNNEGQINFVLTGSEQVVDLYAEISNGDAVELVKFTLTLPAITTQTVNNVSVTGDLTDVVLTVEELADLSGYTVSSGATAVVAYNISLLKGALTVQPNGVVTVKIPVPAGHESDDTLKVYHVVGSDLVDMNATIEGGYLVFETTSFSDYVVTSEQVEQGLAKLSITEFLALDLEDPNWYELTGIVTNVYNEGYGNFYLQDLNDPNITICVYGVRPNENATTSSSQWSSLGVSEGQTITIIGQWGIYNNNVQVANSYYVSHKETELTDSFKAITAIDELSVNGTATEDFVLPEGAVWSMKEASAAASLEVRNVTVTRGEEDVTVVFVATVTFGAVTKTKEFSVIIKSENFGTEEIILEYVFAEKELVNGTKYVDIEANSDINFVIDGGGNSGKYYVSDTTWRMYSTENATLTIQAGSGYTIKSITILWKAVKNSPTLTYNSNNVISGTSYLINDTNALFSMTDGTVGITKITVVYA